MGEESCKYSRCTSFLNCGLFFLIVPALFFGQLFVIFAITLAALLSTSACTFVQANLERKPNPKETLSNFLRSWNIVVFFANGNNVLLKYKYVLNICYVQDVVPVIVI